MLPVAVMRGAEESFFRPMEEVDLEMIRSHVDLVQPGSAGDILSVLSGKGFGREIGKVVAVAAFVLFLLESVLARWVAKSRKSAEDVRVDFGETASWEGGRR